MGTSEILVDAVNKGRKVLTVQESKEILKNLDFPVNPTGFGKDLDELTKLSEKIGYPVVLKVSSEDIVHKTDVGGVKVGIRDKNDLKKEYSNMIDRIKKAKPKAQIDGFIVEKQIDDAIELLIGSTQDPMFGPILAFGLGGIYVEVLKDVVFRLVPIQQEDATEMISEIKGAKILDGVRGRVPVDKKALIDLLMKTSSFIDTNPDIKELDLNPILASEEGVFVVDARIVLS